MRSTRILAVTGVLSLAALACVIPTFDEFLDFNFELEEELDEALATGELLLTADAQATQDTPEPDDEEPAAEGGEPADFENVNCGPLAETRCANLGTHTFEITQKEEYECLGAEIGLQNVWSFNFTADGLNVQHSAWDAPRLHVPVGGGQYYYDYGAETNTQAYVEFFDDGFTLFSQNSDGEDCLFYFYARVD